MTDIISFLIGAAIVYFLMRKQPVTHVVEKHEVKKEEKHIPKEMVCKERLRAEKRSWWEKNNIIT